MAKRRKRRSRNQIEQLERQILDVVKMDAPVSVRHVFYRCTDPRLPEPVDKTEHGYKQVQRRIVHMRRAGLIPYGSITDATRRGYFVQTYGSAAEALRHWHGSFRANLWAGTDVHVEVWCESRSIAGVIEDECRRLAVSLYPSCGFTSLTQAYEAALGINSETRDGELPAYIVYVGDYDPSGVLIPVKIESEIRQHLHPDVDLEFYRLAVRPEQIVALQLPSKPRKKGERRSPQVRETVEAEAIPARTLRAMLRDEIESCLPSGALEATKAAEASERGLILWAAGEIEAA